MIDTNVKLTLEFTSPALAKYLSRLITTFYQKSTINITDLINKNDDFGYNKNFLAHEKGCHETCQKTLWITENPVASGGFAPWTPVGVYAPPHPQREGQVTKLPAIFGFLPSMQKISKNPGGPLGTKGLSNNPPLFTMWLLMRAHSYMQPLVTTTNLQL